MARTGYLERPRPGLPSVKTRPAAGSYSRTWRVREVASPKCEVVSRAALESESLPRCPPGLLSLNLDPPMGLRC